MTVYKGMFISGVALTITLVVSALYHWQLITASIILVLLALPGLAVSIYQKASITKSLLFICATWLSFLVAIALPIIFSSDEEYGFTIMDKLRVLLASVLSTINFFLLFFVFFRRKVAALKNILLIPAMIGLLSIIPSVIASSFIYKVQPTFIESAFIHLASALIFPIWLFLSAQYLNRL